MQVRDLIFTTPKICDRGGDVTKQWYVYFTCTNQATGEVKQFRYKLGINRHKEKAKKKKAAKEALSAIIDMIEHDGFNPFTKEIHKECKYLLDLLGEMLQVKNKTLRPRSQQMYSHTYNQLSDYLKQADMASIEVNQFGKSDAVKFCDYLIKLGFRGKTINNTIGYIKTLFFMLVERGYIKDNPFAGIKKLKEDEGKNVAFTTEEIKRLTAYLKRYNKRLYYATQFVRFAFIRRTELTGIKVRDINLDTHTITIAAEVSKTRKQDSVTIPLSLEKIIKEMDLDSYNPDDYVFGHGLITCSRKLRRIATISAEHRKATIALGMREELIFYGWKHTGCVELFNIVKDPYVVCRQCRHSDIRMTMRYMRSLGLGINEAVRDW